MRVGTIINIIKAWGTYQDKLSFYKESAEQARIDKDKKAEKHWNDYIKMTEEEIGEFLNIVI